MKSFHRVFRTKNEETMFVVVPDADGRQVWVQRWDAGRVPSDVVALPYPAPRSRERADMEVFEEERSRLIAIACRIARVLADDPDADPAVVLVEAFDRDLEATDRARAEAFQDRDLERNR